MEVSGQSGNDGPSHTTPSVSTSPPFRKESVQRPGSQEETIDFVSGPVDRLQASVCLQSTLSGSNPSGRGSPLSNVTSVVAVSKNGNQRNIPSLAGPGFQTPEGPRSYWWLQSVFRSGLLPVLPEGVGFFGGDRLPSPGPGLGPPFHPEELVAGHRYLRPLSRLVSPLAFLFLSGARPG